MKITVVIVELGNDSSSLTDHVTAWATIGRSRDGVNGTLGQTMVNGSVNRFSCCSYGSVRFSHRKHG